MNKRMEYTRDEAIQHAKWLSITAKVKLARKDVLFQHAGQTKLNDLT